MDHPRSRGVYVPPMRRAWAGKGSSPLARGLPEEPGILPETSEDHPRSRGVYTMNSFDSRSAAGSSPLARGLPRRPTSPADSHRIIPARAGFTHQRDPAPHRRGGSSPLARGLLHRLVRVDLGGRIIPARAGFTPPWGRSGRERRDHPRSRGVYWRSTRTSQKGAGSSPLARGLPGTVPGSPAAGRIIPARAGFTRRWPRRRRAPPDHPRSRGVYASWRPSSAVRVGSSPLARGLLAVVVQRLVEGGIIPARAGFTARRHQGGRRHADHPRSRGVYNRRPVHRAATPGSSPLARGLHLEEHSRPPPGGIIPARAGFT